MSYITFNDLQRQTFSKALSINESHRFDERFEKQVFLSYRRKDSQYVRPIVNILKGLGAKIYIDYLDETLPDKPNSETAAILRNRIRNSDKFILMATPNSSESKWIPWELGLGDGFIDYAHVAVLPITNDKYSWSEQEYYSIYGHIRKANSKDGSMNDYAIIYPDQSAEWLINWIRK
jgi:hypothetical protein